MCLVNKFKKLTYTLPPTMPKNLNLKTRFLRLLRFLTRLRPENPPTNIIQFTPAAAPVPPPETVDEYLRRTGMTLTVDGQVLGVNAPTPPLAVAA